MSILSRRSLVTSLILIALAFAIPPLSAHAQNDFMNGINQAGNAAQQGKIFTGTLITAIEQGIKFFLGFVGIIAVAAIIYGGFLYITAFGDEHKTETAKHTLIYAIIGLIVIGAAALITNLIITTFK